MDLLHGGGKAGTGNSTQPFVHALFSVWCTCVFSPEGLYQVNVCKSTVEFCQYFINGIFMCQQEVSVG